MRALSDPVRAGKAYNYKNGINILRLAIMKDIAWSHNISEIVKSETGSDNAFTICSHTDKIIICYTSTKHCPNMILTVHSYLSNTGNVYLNGEKDIFMLEFLEENINV